MKSRVKRASLMLLIIGITYGVLCGLIFTQQRRIIFKPSRDINETPADLGLPFEEVWIPVNSEAQLHGWWIPNRGAKGTLLYLHGNGLNISANLGLAQRYHTLGLSVLMIDYRGYGLSDGAFPQESWTYADAEAALQYLRTQKSIQLDELVLFGHSLGGAIAIHLAQQYPNVAGLIVQSSFSSMEELARTQIWPNLFPLGVILNQRFESHQKVGDLPMPKLWLHGSDDNLIPATMSQMLHQKSPQPSQIEIIEGAGHNNVATVAGDRYDHFIQTFLKHSLSSRFEGSIPKNFESSIGGPLVMLRQQPQRD